MVTTYTLTGNLKNVVPAGSFDANHCVFAIKSNAGTQGITDTAGNKIHLGVYPLTLKAGTLNADGTFSVDIIATNATGIYPSGGTLRYQLVGVYPNGQVSQGKSTRGTYAGPWFTHTATSTLASKVEEYVRPEWMTEAQATLDAHEAGLEDDLTAHSDALCSALTQAGLGNFDEAMVVLDDDNTSAFRVQQDARTASLVGTPIDTTMDAAAFTTFLAGLNDGDVIFVPPNQTLELDAGITLTKPVTILGPGRILDTRTAPTTPFVTITTAASGSRIYCPLDGSVGGQYIEPHNAIYVVGTDHGPGVAATPVSDLTIDVPRISGFGRYAIRSSWICDTTITIDDASYLGHGGWALQSAENVSVAIRRLHDVGPGSGQTYGGDFDRKDSATDLIRYPRSTNCSGTIDVAYNCPGLYLLSSHGGHNLHFEFGSAFGIARAINLGPGEMDNGDDFYAPSNISWRGGYASSGVTDGSVDSGVIVAGGYNVTTDTVVEYATGISGHIDTLVGFGKESDAIGGAVYCRTTKGLALTFGTIVEPAPRAINMYHTNQDYSIGVGMVIDAWSNTLTDADFIAHTGQNNRGVINYLAGARGTKTATHVNTRGVVAASSTNRIRLGAAVDPTAAATPVSGYVSGLVHKTSAAQQAVYIDGTQVALFYNGGLLMANGYKFATAPATTTAAGFQLTAGAAEPTSPISGDMWATTSALRIQIAGATREVFTGFAATATLDFPSIAAGSAQELTVTVTGAATGDAVTLSPPAALEAGLIPSGRVSAANTVTVRLANVTTGAIDPASASWKVKVMK